VGKREEWILLRLWPNPDSKGLYNEMETGKHFRKIAIVVSVVKDF